MAESSRASREEVLKALAAWSDLEVAEVEHLTGGLINQSWRAISGGTEYVVQRVHGDFSPGVHENIQAVSNHLASQGVVVPRLLETDEGALFSERGAGGRWRVMERLPGFSFGKCRGAAQAQSAGSLVARFHAGMMSWHGDLAAIGFPFHDLPQHCADLFQALDDYPDHALHAEVAELARKIAATRESWTAGRALPLRVLHGDLKFSNLLFDGVDPPGCDIAHALIDLDTISRLPLYYDMGDAWRSWCNVGGEGPEDVRLDLEIFRASAEGYLSGLGGQLSSDEEVSLVGALERVSLELSARFAADAINESHFAWDADHFQSAGAHNLHRAQGQLALHDQARETRSERARFLLG